MKYTKKTLEYGVVQADPMPSDEELFEFYRSYYVSPDGSTTGYDSSYTKAELEHKIIESNLALRAIQYNLSPSIDRRTLFEFGCGEGFFLKQAKLENYIVSAIDFSSVGLERWNPNLLNDCQFGNMYDYLEELISSRKKFDVIVLRNVVEHVIKPSVLLSNIKSILNPGGLVLITVPNDYSSLHKKAFELKHIEEEFWFAPPEHLHYFNSKNIRLYLEDYQFKVIDMYSSFPVDFFLFHPGSNYVKNKANGREAHRARIELDLIMAQEGIDNFLNLYRAMANCGMGRNLTVIIKTDSL